ncbi:TIGR01777 family protein [Paenibacillus sp. FSL H8-0548]|uniref:TIGR01777 family oxidoreductase n=1 Tax=Paenibacillus sp. FSL H8-0548 TaxID=1920422 RepID=UPI00096E4A2E|nr:TIGR01777 family oxidoreductase [Paenibacillus sp. FSL H8-0548]OMF38759.1 TIGR01777 family protein [Paenibacillus sp. FSL H8-0548]
MRVAIAGGTGFIGSALTDRLLNRNDEVFIISRSGAREQTRRPGVTHVTWDELDTAPGLLEGIDAIINLAGESINQRWSVAAKHRVMDSRITAAARISKLMNSLEPKPPLVINASGISAYGISSNEIFDESSPMKVTDFLSEVVSNWEQAADAIPAERLVKLRVGVVLDKKDGAFPLMAMPYRLFGGGRIGSGKQWLSWIHLEDMIRLILFILDHEDISGPVNGSSPDPVSNDVFGRAIGKAMGRPHWFPVPAFVMKALFGEMSTLLLDGQRALPRKALDHGFVFRFPTVDSAMNDLVGGR